MEVKVVMTRIVKNEVREKLKPYLIELRNLAIKRPGYISGQTLINVDNPSKVLVISSWKSLQDWNNWLNNSERQIIQNEIDALLEAPTYYEIYMYG